jgi:molybdate transport system substrate-binding protein
VSPFDSVHDLTASFISAKLKSYDDEVSRQREQCALVILKAGARQLRRQSLVKIMFRVAQLRWMQQPSLALALFFVLGCAQTAANAEEILVAAAASLTDALREVGAAYNSKSRHKVNFTFASSSSLARQIDEGAPVDMFFSADLPQMDGLEKRGRVEPGTRKNVLSNQLVIIAPADSTSGVASPKDLLKTQIKRIALAEPSSVPVGIYTRKYLEAEALWDSVRRKIVPVLDVRATLASVEAGNVEVGFVYKTDAAISKKVKTVYEVPIDKGPQITYPVAIVKESKKKEAARDFMNFVLSSTGKQSFKKYGFVILA